VAEFDLIIRNGTVFDGTGRPGFPADVGVKGDRIEAVGNLTGAVAAREIDAADLYVAPGFIDIHTHSDWAMFGNPRMESKIRQGVTTEVAGNCGTSLAPLMGVARESAVRTLSRIGREPDWTTLAEYFARIEANGIAQNYATFIGHGTLRQAVMGFEMRPPTLVELDQMKRLLVEGMEQGALGLATGLIYPPGCYANTEEIIELAKVVASYDGIYATHMRNEADRLLESVAEAIRVGEEAGVSVQISHHKAVGRRNWGKVNDSLELIERARSRGVRVDCDQYPYVASSTNLGVVLPRWVFEGGNEKLLARLADPEVRRRIAEEAGGEYENAENLSRGAGWDGILIADSPQAPHYEGQTIAQVAEAEGKDPLTVVFDLLLLNRGYVGAIFFGMCEEDVRTVMRYPHTVIGSDSSARAPYGIMGFGKPHPRTYGTFPRVLGRYVREEKVLTWEEAIAKMTSKTARKLRLRGRGEVRPGYFADLVVFNPNTVIDQATFTDPHRYPVGIEYVVVNGTLVIDRGEHTGVLPGRVLRLGG